MYEAISNIAGGEYKNPENLKKKNPISCGELNKETVITLYLFQVNTEICVTVSCDSFMLCE